MRPNEKLIIITAPSGSGKSTIMRHLLKRYPRHLAFSVSATTRPRRKNERDGVDYYFLEVSEFKKKIAQDAFVEWEEVYEGRYYGTLKSEILRIQSAERIPVFDVDVIGALDLKNLFPASLSIFIRTPSLQVLKERLVNRNTDSAEAIKKRLAKATHELTFERKFDYILVNDLLEVALKEAELLVEDYLGLNDEEE